MNTKIYENSVKFGTLEVILLKQLLLSTNKLAVLNDVYLLSCSYLTFDS